MAITITTTNPVFISSNSIEVFPCAGRVKGAARYTSEFNLTHLGIPDVSWIVGVKNSAGSNKAVPANMEAGDVVSIIINGYFFEFIVPSGTWTGNVYASILLNKSDSGDAVEKQWKLTPIISGEALTTSFDIMPQSQSQFIGMALTTGDPLKLGDDNISGAQLAVKSLQLTNSGDYVDVGRLPIQLASGSVDTVQLKDGAVTTAKITDGAVTAAKLSNSSVTTAKINNKAVTAAKLGQDVVDSTIDKLGDSNNNTLQVNLAGGNGSSIKAVLSGSVGTGDIADDAVTAAKLGNIITTGSAEDNGITVSLSQDSSTGGLVIGVNANAVGSVDTAANANYLNASGIQTANKQLDITVDDGTKTPLGVKLLRNSSTKKIYAELTGGINASNIYDQTISTEKIVDTAITTDKIASGAVDARCLSGNVCQSDPQFLGGDEEGLGIQLAGGASGPIRATPIGGVSTSNIKDNAITTPKLQDQAVTVEKLAGSMFESWHITDCGLTSGVFIIEDSTGAKKLVTKLYGQCSSAYFAENAANLTGQLYSSNLPDGIIEDRMFASTATAPRAKEIQINGTAYTLSLNGNVLTIS